MEFERFIDRLKDSGLEDVAADVNDVLEYHRDKLPPHLPGTLVEIPIVDKENLVITQDFLEDPKRSADILWAILTPLENEYPKGDISRTGNAIIRPWLRSENRGRSMAEILNLSDGELLEFRNFGKISLGIFKRATEELRDKFVQPQNP